MKKMMGVFLGLILFSTAAEATVVLVSNNQGCFTRRTTSYGTWLYTFIHAGDCVLTSINEHTQTGRYKACPYAVYGDATPEMYAQAERLCNQE